jgi:hypothetical protein
MPNMPLDLTDAELATAANRLPRDGVPRGRASEGDGKSRYAAADREFSAALCSAC